MMKAVIIDDEKDCRQVVETLLNEHFSEIRICGQAASVAKGRELIMNENPDVLLLDIELGDGNAFDLLAGLNKLNFQVIFITAYEQYAIQAIRHSAIDYILKPVDPQAFIQAIDKVKRMSDNMGLLSKQIKVLLENRSDFNRIALPTLEGFRFVNIDDIIHCKAESNYTWFHLKNNEKILVTKTLKEYDETLSEKYFVRVHQSHLINIKYVEKYIKGEGGTVVMADGTEVIVSRRRKDQFLRKMKGRF